MPAKDLLHDAAKNALIKDGWTITNDPYTLEWDVDNIFIDLGAERVLAAQKDTEKIAVEVKSFVNKSETRDLQQAVGQVLMYRTALEEQDPERVLYLAMPDEIAHRLFEQPRGSKLFANAQLKVIGFDPEKEEIVSWMK